MTKQTSFIQQGTILAMTSILVRVIGIIYRVPLANIIGDEANGIYSAAFEVYSLALLLSSYSLPLAVSKLLSAQLIKGKYHTAQKTFITAIAFAVASGGAMGVLVFGSANYIEERFYSDFKGIALPLRVLAITIFVVALLGTFRGYFQARNTMIPTAISQVVEQIINAIISLFFGWKFAHIYTNMDVKSARGAAGGTIGTLFGAIFGLLFLLFMFVKSDTIEKEQLINEKQTYCDDIKKIFRSLIVTIIPVMLGQTVYQAIGVIDGIMFSNMYIDQNVVVLYGIYSTKYRLLVNVPIAIASAIASSSIPAIVADFTMGKKVEIISKSSLSIKLNMIIAMPCAVGLSILGKPIVKMLFPSTDYEIGGSLLLTGGIAVIFYALSTVTNATLQAINLMGKTMINSLISLAIHVFFLWIMLRFTNLGVYALVIGNVIFPMIVCILNYYTLYNQFCYKQETKTTFILPMISSTVMGIFVYLIYVVINKLFSSNIVAIFMAILGGGIIYFMLIIVIGAITEKDFNEFPMGIRIKRIALKLHLIK